MTWSEHEWDTFTGLLEDGWPGEFDDRRADAYRVLLDGIEPGEAVRALRVLLRTSKFRPSTAEIVQAAEQDPSKPTFDEAYQLIFGPRGVLRARPAVARWGSEGERRRLFNEAAMDRAASMHPLIGSFCERQGLDRLRGMPVDDPDQGHWRRRELQQAWQEHVEASAGREVAVLAAGASGKGLRRLDPLAGLEAPRQQLTEGVTR